jgi:hypothetical protein
MLDERSGAPLPRANKVTPASLGGRPISCEIWERIQEKNSSAALLITLNRRVRRRKQEKNVAVERMALSCGWMRQ